MEPELSVTVHNEHQIIIKVDPPELKTELGGASKFYLYHIHGKDKFSEISVYRRYSDFIVLKNQMMTRWPGVYIPPLPQKKFIGNNDTEFVDYRRHGLEEFLFLISEVDFLWYADQFQLFIKNNISDVEKSLNNMGKSTFKELSIKYQTVFANRFQNKQQVQGLGSKIIEFRTYLKNAQILLEKMAKVSDAMTEARRKFEEKYAQFLETFMPQYQDKCIKYYLPSEYEVSMYLYFAKNSSQNLADQSKNLIKTFSTHGKQIPGESLRNQYAHNSLSLVNELIKQQIRELTNFGQILIIKESYDNLRHRAISRLKDLQLEQSKIAAGNQSLVAKLKNQNKQELMHANKIALEKARKQLEEVEKICELIEVVLVTQEIERFKQKRTENYYKVVKMMAQSEKNTSEAEGELWNKIAGFEQQFLDEPVKNEEDRSSMKKKIETEIRINKQPVSQQQKIPSHEFEEKQQQKPQKAVEQIQQPQQTNQNQIEQQEQVDKQQEENQIQEQTEQAKIEEEK